MAATVSRLPVLACTTPRAGALKRPNTLWPGAKVPEKPATGIPVMADLSRGWAAPEARITRLVSAAGVTRSSGERPLPLTRWMTPGMPRPASTRVTAVAAPLNVRGRAGMQRNLPGEVLRDHVVALPQHPADDVGQRRRRDRGDGGRPRRRCPLGHRAGHADPVGAEEGPEGPRRLRGRGG